MMKRFFYLLGSVFAFLFSMPQVYAHCPLCAIAVGNGVVLARFWGLNDIIVGIWVGAFVVSMGLWVHKLLKKNYIPLQEYVFTILSFAATAIPFYFAGLIGNPMYVKWGIDMLLLGMVVGTVLTVLGFEISKLIKAKRGKTLIPFQTIIFTVMLLAIASLIFWLVI